MVRKSYTALKDFSHNDVNGNLTAYSSGDTLYLEEAVGDGLVTRGICLASTAYLNICTAEAVTGSGGDITVDTKTVYTVLEGTTITVTVAVPATSANVMAAGTVLTMTIKDSSGSTIETRSHTFAQVAIGSSEVATFFTPAGLIAGDDIDFDLVLKDGGSDYTATADVALVTPSDIDGVIFTVGASVAATNPIVTNLQFVDSSGDAVDNRVVCEIFPMDDFDALATLTACTAGTDGANFGTMGSNSSFMAISEADGDLDVTMTMAGAGRARVGCRLPDGRLFISDEAIWT